MDIVQSVKTAVAPPHREGWPFIAGGVALAFLGLLVWHVLAWVGVVFAGFCLYFFRDPERVLPPQTDVFVAPADGLVVSIEPATPPAELGIPELRTRIAIFLSVLDVHVNRAPIAATVSHVAYHPGQFLAAGEEKASDVNERNSLALTLPGGETVALVQIAGLIARRIVCDVKPGQAVAAGQRIGMIRFGSRTDLYLPAGVIPLVAVGQRMIGGETVVAELSRRLDKSAGTTRLDV